MNARRRARVIACAVVGTVCLAAAPATADTVFVPFAGRSSGQADPVRVATIGASLMSLGVGSLGFEVDYGRTSESPGGATFAPSSRVTTIMGNLLIGVPFGRFRPYVTGGFGWIQTAIQQGGASAKSGGLGIDGGFGLLGFVSGNVGVRVDLRHVRGVTASDLDTLRLPDSARLDQFVSGQVGFWRTSVGLGLRF